MHSIGATPPAASTTDCRYRRSVLLTIVLAVACLISSARCGLSLHDSDAAAQATAVIFGRVLSGPGMASHNMAAPTGVARMNVTIADASSSRTISTATTGSDGTFRFAVPPGDYSVKGPGNPHLVHVDPGQQLQVDLYMPNP